VDPNYTCADVKRRTEAKIVDVAGKIQALQKIKEALAHLAGLRWGSGPISECPILEALDSKDILEKKQ
jgi:MerR family mercuric resistance operon transcriptional regulator